MIISIDDVEFTAEESEFLKAAIEDALIFWGDAKDLTGDFPWELVPMGRELIINQSAVEKLRALGVKIEGFF